MVEGSTRVIIVSGRLLLAQGIKSLLENEWGTWHIEIISGYYNAIMRARVAPPDMFVVDLPPGSNFFIDRAITVGGREIKTIVLEDVAGQARFYVHDPGMAANLYSLLQAVEEHSRKGMGHTEGLGALVSPAQEIA